MDEATKQDECISEEAILFHHVPVLRKNHLPNNYAQFESRNHKLFICSCQERDHSAFN